MLPNKKYSGSSVEARLDQLELVLKTISIQGSPKAPFWFMGLEESTCPTISADEQICFQYKSALEQTKGPVELTYARELRKYQPTWAGYIKLMFSVRDAAGDSTTPWIKDDVLDYQFNKLGSLDTTDQYSASLLELFPLPRKSRRKHGWIYGDIANRPGMEFLSTKRSFSAHPWVRGRADLILETVKKHQPRVLFVCGKDGEYALRHLVDKVRLFDVIKNDKKEIASVPIGQWGSTRIVFAYHPTSFQEDRYWRELGSVVAGQAA